MIPTDHSRGYFKFNSPYDVAIQPNTLLTCLGSITLPQLEKEGLEPMKTVYAPFGLTEDDYNDDLRDKVSIVILTPGTGTVYVPSDRILSISQADRIPYSKVLIGVNLGTLPTGLNIENLMEDIKLLVEERIGVKPTITKSRDGTVLMVSKEDHQQNASERAQVSTNPFNYKIQLHQLDLELNRKNDLLTHLTNAIENGL